MADVILLKRAAGKGHLTSLLEGTDDAALSSIQRTNSNTDTLASLWTDAITTGITIGGSAQTTGDLFGGSAMTTLDIGLGMGAGDGLTLGGAGSTVTISGDLVVSGTTISVDSEVVNIADNHLYLNKDYTTVAAQTGGLVVNYLPTAVVDESGIATVNPGFDTTTTVETDAATIFSAGDFIQISGANIAANDGLYEVFSHAANILTIDSTPTHSFSQTAFTVDATDGTATITQVTVSAIQAGTDGVWETGFADTAAGLTFTDLASASGSTLQTAYDSGNTIAMTDVDGDFTVSVGSGNPSILLDAADNSNFTVAGANLTLSTTSSGAVDVTSAGLLDLDAAGVLSINSSGGAINIGDDNVAQNVNIGILAARTITVGNVAATEVQIDALLVDINAGSGGVHLDGAGNSNLTTSVGGLTLDGAGGVTVQANAGPLDMDGAAVTLDGTTGVDINGSGAPSFFTSTSQDLSIETITSGVINIQSIAEIDMDGTTVAIDASTAMNVTTTTGTLTLSTSGSGALDVTSAGTLDIQAAGALTIDASGSNAISIGNDPNTGTIEVAGTGSGARTVNVGTAGAIMGVTVGSINTSSATTIDAGTGGISIGNSLAAMTISIGTVGVGVKTIVIGEDTVAGSSVSIKSGGTGDITFDANGMTAALPLNGTTSGDTGNQDLSTSFTASTLVGVLNELKEAGVAEADAVISDLVTTGLALGNPVYITGTDDTTAATDASAIATAESFVGIVRTIGALGTGEVVTSGTAAALVEAGLTTGDYPVAGDPIYLSETTGRVTTIAPTGNPQTGIVIYQIGYVRNDTGLTPTTTGATDLLNIELRPGTFIEL